MSGTHAPVEPVRPPAQHPGGSLDLSTVRTHLCMPTDSLTTVKDHPYEPGFLAPRCVHGRLAEHLVQDEDCAADHPRLVSVGGGQDLQISGGDGAGIAIKGFA